jgi:hypothetical protein
MPRQNGYALHLHHQRGRSERTQHNLRIQIVDNLANELRLDGDLVSQHAQVVRQVSVLGDDYALPTVLKLRPPRAPEDLLYIQHACKQVGRVSLETGCTRGGTRWKEEGP